jgi:hypothetical protein
MGWQWVPGRGDPAGTDIAWATSTRTGEYPSDLGHLARMTAVNRRTRKFARAFPRLRMVINTTIAMPIAVYRAIAEQIIRTVNRAKCWSKRQLEANDRIKSAAVSRVRCGEAGRRFRPGPASSRQS